MNSATLTIREANPDTDYERAAALISAASVEPVTAKQIQGWDKNTPSGQIRRRMVATNADNEVIAYSQIQRFAKDVHTQSFYVWVTVDEAYRRQGIGAQMYDNAKAVAYEHGARELTSESLDNDPNSLRFAEKRGFRIHKHAFASRLDLTAFDEAPFVECIARVEAMGIRFSSLAAEGNTPEAQFKLYTLNNQTAQDNPTLDHQEAFPAFEIFQHQVLNADWFRADGQILAIEGEQYVGLGAIAMNGETAYSAFTGVDSAYRGRGLAQALKLLTVRFAIANGARSLLTDNDSQNAPMLRVNRKFGFKPETGMYKLLNKHFASGAGRNVRIWLTV
ncbi:MAG: GNAT family N-acetyltransferase [Anaerolineae bacterium]